MNKIEQERKDKGWTRRELEDKSDVSFMTIYMLEKQDYKAKSWIIQKIANALDLSLDELKEVVK